MQLKGDESESLIHLHRQMELFKGSYNKLQPVAWPYLEDCFLFTRMSVTLTGIQHLILHANTRESPFSIFGNSWTACIYCPKHSHSTTVHSAEYNTHNHTKPNNVLKTKLLPFFISQLYGPIGIFPMENSGQFPGESPPQQNCTTQPTVHAVVFKGFRDPSTTGSLKCPCDLFACLCIWGDLGLWSRLNDFCGILSLHRILTPPKHLQLAHKASHQTLTCPCCHTQLCLTTAFESQCSCCVPPDLRTFLLIYNG